MPIMDGYTATQNIRYLEKENQFQPTPVVALTAGFDKEDELRCKSVGMDHYITKPFSISELKMVLQSFIGYTGIVSSKKTPKDTPNITLSASSLSPTETEKIEDILNLSALENIREVERQTNNPLLATVFSGFIDQMNEKLEKLQDSLSAENSDSLYKTAHAIKSMSANIGAKKVQDISAEIESIARSGSVLDIETRISELHAAYDQFINVFQSELSEQTT